MKISLIGLAQNAAGELERAFQKAERTRKSHGDCDCALCCDVDHRGAYAACLRQLAEHATEVKADPSKVGEFLELYALVRRSATADADRVTDGSVR
jgi:hypothetical protein